MNRGSLPVHLHYGSFLRALLHGPDACFLDARMFRAYGHEKIWVLDGGLPQWRASGYDVESSASSDAILKASAASEAIEKVYQGQSVIVFKSSLFC